jgi:hypothetical protein
MSAINLYTTKAEALYFKDSQRNNFYEFGGIQLLPNETYIQKLTDIELKNTYKATILRVSDDSVIGNLPYSIQEANYAVIYAASDIIYAASNTITVGSNTDSVSYISITPSQDCNNDLIYIGFSDVDNNTVYAASNTIYAASNSNINSNSNSNYNYYSNPFYITSLDEDNTTKFTYKNLSSNNYESIGLKVWFRQKSRQSELTTYYESSTRNTVTQAIKTHNLEMYESEFMSIDDLIMTAEILESPYLYIDNKRYSLFEAVKIPELTQQENFAKIKFTLAPNN